MTSEERSEFSPVNDVINAKMTRRQAISRVAKFGIAAAVVVAAGGGFAAYELLPQSNSALPKSITNLFPGGSWQTYYTQVFGAYMKKQYGVTMNYDLASGPSVEETKLQADKSSPTDDVDGDTDGVSAAGFGAQGLFQKLDTTRISNYADIIPAATNDYFIGEILAPFGLGYNSAQVPNGISAWTDLAKPELKGKVAIPDWSWEGMEWVNFINKAVFNGTEDDITPAMNWVAGLVKNNDAIIMKSTDDGLQQFTNGTIWAAPFWSSRTYEVTSNGGPKMDFVYPEQGTMALYFGLGIVNNLPKERLDAAYLLADAISDPTLQAQFSPLTGYPPTNSKAFSQISAADIAKNPSLSVSPSQLATFSKVKLDAVKMVQNSANNLKLWQTMVLGA